MRIAIASVCLLVVSFQLQAGEPIVLPLWESGAPGFEDRKDEAEEAKDWWVKNVHYPTLTAYLPDPDKATGVSVIVCPGGGHRLLVVDAEGTDPALHLQSQGIAAFVLKYRLGREENSPYAIDKHAIEDGQRAIRLVRSKAKEFHLDANRVGMLGFSAGGEVVSMVTYSDPKAIISKIDDIDELSSRPDFQMMVYPGPLGIPDAIPADAPPAFLLVANDDGAAKTILDLLTKYRAVNRPVEAHIFGSGGHGFNMGQRSKLKSLSTWPKRMDEWLMDYVVAPPPPDQK